MTQINRRTENPSNATTIEENHFSPDEYFFPSLFCLIFVWTAKIIQDDIFNG